MKQLQYPFFPLDISKIKSINIDGKEIEFYWLVKNEKDAQIAGQLKRPSR